MGVASRTFQQFVAMKDTFPEDVCLDSMIRSLYEEQGWSEELVQADIVTLKNQFIDSVELLRQAIENGYGYKVGIPSLAIDLISKKMKLTFKNLFDRIPEALQWNDELCSFKEELERHRIRKPSDLLLYSKKGWKKSTVPIGLKLKLYNFIIDKGEEIQLELTLPKEVESLHISGTGDPGRMRVRSSDGRMYEVDRYCPHKGADMMGAEIHGTLITCPRHRWHFDMSLGGMCLDGKKACSINSLALDW